ncbi:MAG: BON domain-containing protein [Acidobacteria bacterium]|nr:BON domain-containing protein [Acidobacteriota bacterium]
MRKWLLILLSAMAVLVANCNTARNTGTTVKEGTVAAAQEAGDKIEDVGDVAEGVADKTEDVAQKAAEKTEDATITSAIKTKMASDDLVKASAIDVDTRDGHVTLSGTVRSHAEHERALSIARSVAGVKGVTDRLTIQPNK